MSSRNNYFRYKIIDGRNKGVYGGKNEEEVKNSVSGFGKYNDAYAKYFQGKRQKLVSAMSVLSLDVATIGTALNSSNLNCCGRGIKKKVNQHKRWFPVMS